MDAGLAVICVQGQFIIFLYELNLMLQDGWSHGLLNHIELRTVTIVYNFGLSDCSGVKLDDFVGVNYVIFCLYVIMLHYCS